MKWQKLPLMLGIFPLLWLLAACASKVGPDYQPPEPKLPASWLEAEAERARSDLPLDQAWWQVFGSPVMDRLIDEAYRQNPSLRVAGLRVMETRAQLGIAVGNLYPQVQQANGSLTYSKASARSSTAPQPGNGSGQLQAWQDTVSLNAAWEIDFWGKYRRSIESAEATLQSSVADYDNALVSLTSNVASAYVSVRTYEERLRIARENLALQQESLKIAQAKLQYGSTSDRDVQQAVSQLKTTQAGIADLEAGLAQAKHALSLLLGRAPGGADEFIAGAAPIPAAPRQVAVGLPTDLLRRRPDIRSAELAAAAQCARIGVAEAQLYPSFSLSGNIGYLSTTVGKFGLSDMFSQQGFNGSFGPSVTWNIFNYGRITNAVRVEDARFQEALDTYRNTVLSALRETEDNMSAFLRGQDRADSLREAVEAARASANLATIQYSAGQTDFTTVIQAQQNLLSATDSLASTQGNIALNLIGLYRALGGGWEIRQGKDFVPSEEKSEMAQRTNWGDLLKETPQETAEPQQRGADRYTPDW